MEKFIEIHDNLLSPSLVNSIENLVLNQTKYNYVPNITSNTSSDYKPGFSFNFIDRNKNFYDPNCFFLSQILYILGQHKSMNIINIIKGRSFLQLPHSTLSSSNHIHTDFNFPHWVCLYYVTDSDGDTIMFNDNEDEIERISPKKGRIVFFDGSIKHCSTSPTKTHRSVVNFDFLGEKF